ncbi:MAG TPA: esterase [Blastocatellia bacterium]|nr:esterase [Blastocatellia bacterium]
MIHEKGDKMKSRFGLVIAIVTIAVSAQAIAAQVAATNGPGKLMSWTVDGNERKAIVFAPKYTAKGQRLPLIFAFHGHGGNMNGTAQLMHIQTVWPEAIVVYPQGLNSPSHVDSEGIKPGWQVEANQTDGNVGNRDLDFFDTMLATMRQTYPVDDKRIYSTGFSNGAVFSYLLWAERSKTIAAIGEVAGRLWDTEHLTEPRPILAIAGRLDKVDLFDLQLKSIENDQQVDSATGPGQPCGPICTFYTSTTQTPVKTFIHPGAHVYPPWAPAEIVEFFKAHHL